MADYFVSDVELTDVADAIREKGGTSAPLEWPGGFVEAIGDISGGGSSGGSLSDPIRFFDYDGTLVASYTSVPDALPDNPSHDGLIAQGWNYTLAQIQTQFADTGTCDIGQMYITESGDTEIDISLPDGRLSPTLNLAPKGTVTINWGDGSSTGTLTGTSLTTRKGVEHSYAAAGDYTISVHVDSGSVALYSTNSYPLLSKTPAAVQHNNRVYANCVRAVRIGANTSIGKQAFYFCSSLSSVTIPSSVTSIGTIAFYSCYSLSSVTIPSGVTSVADSAFYYCYSLSSVAIPSSVTSIGNNAFYYCYSLHSVTIPSGVTSIGGSAFYYCHSLRSVTIPSGVTSIGGSAFYYCYSLPSVTIPSGVTSVATYTFYNCYSLSSVTIPRGVTSIAGYAFYNCYSLPSVTIPSSVTSIEARGFGICYGLGEIHFLSTTPPTVADSNAWGNIPTDCKIYVPTGSLSAYTSASNYPSSSTYTYIEE